MSDDDKKDEYGFSNMDFEELTTLPFDNWNWIHYAIVFSPIVVVALAFAIYYWTI